MPSRTERLIELNSKAREVIELSRGDMIRKLLVGGEKIDPMLKAAIEKNSKKFNKVFIRPKGRTKDGIRDMQTARNYVAAQVKYVRKYGEAFSAKAQRLIEFNQAATIELAKYDDDLPYGQIAVGVGGAGALGAGGLYLRNRGDDINAARHAELLKKGAGAALPAGVSGPTPVPEKFKDFRGSNTYAIKTGAKDILEKIKGRLGKLATTRKMSAREVRLIHLNTKAGKAIELDTTDAVLTTAGLGGAAGVGLYHRGQRIKVTKKEAAEWEKGNRDQYGMNRTRTKELLAERRSRKAARVTGYIEEPGMVRNITKGAQAIPGDLSRIGKRLLKAVR